MFEQDKVPDLNNISHTMKQPYDEIINIKKLNNNILSVVNKLREAKEFLQKK